MESHWIGIITLIAALVILILGVGACFVVCSRLRVSTDELRKLQEAVHYLTSKQQESEAGIGNTKKHRTMFG